MANLLPEFSKKIILGTKLRLEMLHAWGLIPSLQVERATDKLTEPMSSTIHLPPEYDQAPSPHGVGS